MDSGESDLLIRLKNTLRELEESNIRTASIDELKQHLQILIELLERK